MRSMVYLSALALLLPVAAGCGPTQSKVSGQVTFDGKPLPGGMVIFRPADPKRNAVSAQLDEQGNYEAMIPVGEVKVSVDNRELETRSSIGGGLQLNLPFSPEAKKALASAKPDQPPVKDTENVPAKAAGKYRKIPDKYYDVETSGLQFKVESGSQKHDIPLTK